MRKILINSSDSSDKEDKLKINKTRDYVLIFTSNSLPRNKESEEVVIMKRSDVGINSVKKAWKLIKHF